MFQLLNKCNARCLSWSYELADFILVSWHDDGATGESNALKRLMHEHDNLRELMALSPGLWRQSLRYAIKKPICHSVRLRPNLSWSPEYNKLTLFQQWEEPSSSSNPQSDITSEEHHKILLRFLSTNTFKISSLSRLCEYPLYDFEHTDTISIHTSRGHQNIWR